MTSGAVEHPDTPIRTGVRSAAGDVDASSLWDAPFALSVVVPTRNEAGNIEPLVRRLEQILPDRPLEIIFVDDSSDETPFVVETVSLDSTREVRLLHRPEGEREGGLGGAVQAGMRMARAPWICVMDGDLQHPPEVIPQLLQRSRETGADLVVASRYAGDGTVGNGLSKVRHLASQAMTHSARVFFPSRMRAVSDPLSGFFLVRRDAVPVDDLKPRGFKILLEIVARSPELKVADVPFEFGERHAGESKASVSEGMIYLSQLVRLRFGSLAGRFSRFALVGASGLGVNMAAFALLFAAGLHYLAAAIIATQISTLWLFALTDKWVFRGRRLHYSQWSRAALYFVMNNGAFLLRGPLLYVFIAGAGMNALLANFVSLAALTLVRFAMADSWIWREAPPEGYFAYKYDVHGIVTVASEARLPELTRFRVEDLDDEPTVRVRIDKLAPLPEGLAAEAAYDMFNVRYDEGLGRAGFAAEITKGPTSTAIVATPLLRGSPHVLYTNVVEPVLRWAFVERGYTLVHAACVSFGGNAVFVTARTDTGKTTTILKTLDNHPGAFVSDDLTVLTPEGRVLTYPKPLTVSAHTVGAVKTPRLNRKQRMGLPLQSRLHSRSGREFGFLLAKTGLPVATINALVQRIVPPPKYDIEVLIPGVDIVDEARLAGVVIIERGEDEEIELHSDEATSIVLSNCEDAYGFPPYDEIAPFLHGTGDADLHHREREIVQSALRNLPAKLVRSSTMDWWLRLPSVVEGIVPGELGNQRRPNGDGSHGNDSDTEGSSDNDSSGHASHGSGSDGNGSHPNGRPTGPSDTTNGGATPKSPIVPLFAVLPGEAASTVAPQESASLPTNGNGDGNGNGAGLTLVPAPVTTSLRTAPAPAPAPAVEPTPEPEPEPAPEADDVADPPATTSTSTAPWRRWLRDPRVLTSAILIGILAVAALLRFFAINRYGFNSDEVVYSSQGGAIANDPSVSGLFPVFRAHPLLFQSTLSIGWIFGGVELFGRALSAVFGLITILLTYHTGRLLFNRPAGLLAAAFMAVMPYHVLVSRQVLLDGPMAMFATLTLYALVRYAISQRPIWLYATAGSLGLTFLAKESGILFLGSVFVFFALVPQVRIRLAHLAGALGLLSLIVISFPLTVSLAGKSTTGGAYLVWQLFRRPNHTLSFYPIEVSAAVGYLVIIAALLGLWLFRKKRGWRETLLISWIVVPAIFFELYPVKGFQYLIALAPALAILAARPVAHWILTRRVGLGLPRPQMRWVGAAAAAAIVISLLVPTWQRIQPTTSDTFLAGSGGVPAGREAGEWIRDNVPEGARFVTVGPSMANILQFYSGREARGLSVSPNPLRRNPAYEPVRNPDLEIRESRVQYLVWDSFSAGRSDFFSNKLLRYADRYNGRVVHSETVTVTVTTPTGEKAEKPLIVIYEVRPVLGSPPGDEDD